jgi:hypothetical protein
MRLMSVLALVPKSIHLLQVALKAASGDLALAFAFAFPLGLAFPFAFAFAFGSG